MGGMRIAALVLVLSLVACGGVAEDGAPCPVPAPVPTVDAATAPAPDAGVDAAPEASAPDAGEWRRPALIGGAHVYNTLAHVCSVRHDYCPTANEPSSEECIASLAVGALKNPAAGGCGAGQVGDCLNALRDAAAVEPRVCPTAVTPPAACAVCWSL